MFLYSASFHPSLLHFTYHSGASATDPRRGVLPGRCASRRRSTGQRAESRKGKRATRGCNTPPIIWTTSPPALGQGCDRQSPNRKSSSPPDRPTIEDRNTQISPVHTLLLIAYCPSHTVCRIPYTLTSHSYSSSPTQDPIKPKKNTKRNEMKIPRRSRPRSRSYFLLWSLRAREAWEHLNATIFPIT